VVVVGWLGSISILAARPRWIVLSQERENSRLVLTLVVGAGGRPESAAGLSRRPASSGCRARLARGANLAAALRQRCARAARPPPRSHPLAVSPSAAAHTHAYYMRFTYERTLVVRRRLPAAVAPRWRRPSWRAPPRPLSRPRPLPRPRRVPESAVHTREAALRGAPLRSRRHPNRSAWRPSRRPVAANSRFAFRSPSTLVRAGDACAAATSCRRRHATRRQSIDSLEVAGRLGRPSSTMPPLAPHTRPIVGVHRGATNGPLAPLGPTLNSEFASAPTTSHQSST
jgi:hypothetical protein